MNEQRRQKLRFLIVTIFFISCTMLLWSSIFVRFVHYHSQSRLVKPDDYNVKIISQEDYRLLSNPSNREVLLSDGTKMTKVDKSDANFLPNYKAIDGDKKYVLVTLKGTAPFVSIWMSYAIPLLVLSLLGLFISFSLLKSKPKEN